MEIFRTPPERFAELPGFPYGAHYRDWRGIRLAHIDEGEGPPVVLLHGEPTWSFIYRKLIPPLLQAGFRCIAPDLPGFGRSDKPVDPSWYSYDNHTSAVTSLFDELDLRRAALIMHDWGGPIGLRIAALERPERIRRIVAMDTGVFTGQQQMSQAWLRFREFVAGNRDLPIARLIRGGCMNAPGPEVLASYEAPFPNQASKAGAWAFPQLIPLTSNAPGAEVGRAVVEALIRKRLPALVLWADSDAALPLEPVGRQVHSLLSAAAELTVIRGAGHFLQEDQAEQVGTAITAWLAADSAGASRPDL